MRANEGNDPEHGGADGPELVDRDVAAQLASRYGVELGP
jgi:hypothetical protein